MAKKSNKSKKEFDLFDGEVTDAMDKALDALTEKSKQVTFQAGDAQVLNMLTLPNIHLQWLFGCKGPIIGRVIELFGPESVGKSSLLYWLFGLAMNQNCPCLYIEREHKFQKERIAQLLSADRQTAAKMLKRLAIIQPNTLDDMYESLKNWVEKMRKEVKIPMNVPLIAGLDTFSAFLTEKELETGVGPGMPGGHAKFASRWMREWADFAEKNAVILIIVSQQKDKVAMSGGPKGPTLGADVSERFNKTKIGGRAFNFHSTHQMVMLRRGFVKDSDGANCGDKILLEVVKNGIGKPRNQLLFDLLWVSPPDPKSPSPLQECPIRFESTAAEWMAVHRLFGVHEEGGNKYSSKELGVKSASPAEMMVQVNMRPDLVIKAGQMFRIYGYDTDEAPPVLAVEGGVTLDAESEVAEDAGEATV